MIDKNNEKLYILKMVCKVNNYLKYKYCQERESLINIWNFFQVSFFTQGLVSSSKRFSLSIKCD